MTTNSELTKLVERIERLEEEKKTIATDIRELYAEAKGKGYEPKIIRQIVRERRMKETDFAEQQALLDVYRHELGMLADTPLGRAAVASAEGSLKRAVHDKLVAAGAKHEGGNVYTMPEKTGGK